MTATQLPIAQTDAEDNDLTEKQRKFVAIAAKHADVFATRAAQTDREASFPFENFKEMHESGYMRLCLPKEFDGFEASLEDLCVAQERLAHGCGSTALSANMHLFGTGTMAERWRNGEAEVETPMRMIQEGLTSGGSLSEAASSDPFRFPSGKVERVEGGYRVSGRKVFGSNTPINPIVFFNGILEEDGKRTVVMMQFPKETEGVKVIEDWDTLGMRGTGSYSIEFDNAFVPEMFASTTWDPDASIAESGFVAPFVCWFGPTIGAVYTGISVAARNIARETIAGRSRLPHGELKHAPASQYALAEMYINIEAARAFVRRTARRLSDPGFRDLHAIALSMATKQLAVEQAKRTVDIAMELVGGAAFFKRLPLERMYRDVRAGGFHPFNRYDAYEAIGKAELGISDTQEPRFV